jgi:hypothetical protein
MFATNDYLFAVSGGAKYVIIDVKDLAAPKYVSEYRHPNARIHDLWVRDGIAYSAQGGVGTGRGRRRQRQVRRVDRTPEAHHGVRRQQRARDLPLRAGLDRQDLSLHR